MRIIYTLWLRELKRFVRDKSRIVGNLSMPVIWLAIMGTGLNSSFTLPGIQTNYLQFMAPGIVGMSILFTSIFAGISVIWDKQFGFMKEMLVAPVSRTQIVLGKIAGSVTISSITAIMVLIIAILLGGIQFSQITLIAFLEILIFMILTSSVFVGIGLAIASRLNNTEGFQMIMSFFIMPLFFLSGAFFPINNVPMWMKPIIFIDPLMYGVDGIRGALTGVTQIAPIVDIGVLFGLTIIVTFITAQLFKKMEL